MIWPPEYLFNALRNARIYGVAFDAAWPAAIADAAGIADESDEWEAAFWETRGAWEAAFTGASPTRPEEALRTVGAALEVVEDRARCRCVHCNGWIPVDRDPEQGRAEYCSDRCRRDAGHLLEGRVRSQRRVDGIDDPEWLDFDVGRSLTLTLSRSLKPRNRNGIGESK
jgi:hypothetical protein